MYPPRCCGQVIPLASVRSIISDLSAAVAKKAIEFEAADRTYHSTPSCHIFIPPARIIKNIAPCLKCGKTTCSICKNAAHLGKCPLDHNTKLLVTLAEKKVWQFCGKCHNLVARIDGCDEMTCRCGHQFCYDCGGPYGRCRCEYHDSEWSEWELDSSYRLDRPT
ncbi:hypothetical protein E4T50_02774 [Aureobasidium sp. EXF-12298]|nr:hypothetical protein E4T50_02774 [Aureobasidium sp. EXF-12298]